MLEEFLRNIGYNDDEMDLILSAYPVRNYTESTLLYTMKNLVNFLHRNGISNNSIIYITTTTPNIIFMSIENIKERIKDLFNYGFNKVEVFQMIESYPYILEMSNQRINNKYQLFLEIGFQEDDINELLVKKPELLNRDPSSIKKRVQSLIDFGYTKNSIVTILRSVPDLIDMNQHTLNKKIEEYSDFGFTNDEIIQITSYLPELYIYNKEDIDIKTKKLTENGFTTKDIINTIKRLPIILKHNYLDRVDENIDILATMGCGQKEIVYSNKNFAFELNDLIVNLPKKNPYVLLYVKEILLDNFKCFIECGYSNQETIQMINDTPLLLTYNTKELNTRIHYYKDKKLLDEIKNNSTYLLYSLELIKQREKYVKKNSDLFLTDQEFYSKYKVDRDTVLGGGK